MSEERAEYIATRENADLAEAITEITNLKILECYRGRFDFSGTIDVGTLLDRQLSDLCTRIIEGTGLVQRVPCETKFIAAELIAAANSANPGTGAGDQAPNGAPIGQKAVGESLEGEGAGGASPASVEDTEDPRPPDPTGKLLNGKGKKLKRTNVFDKNSNSSTPIALLRKRLDRAIDAGVPFDSIATRAGLHQNTLHGIRDGSRPHQGTCEKLSTGLDALGY